jgi:3-oxoacyl-[acyl-carrier protein] reductase
VTVQATYADLSGRRTLVTGASSGIGLGVAEAFLAQGMSVAVHYRSSRAAAEALASRFPGRAFPVQAELGTEAGCVACVAEAARALGGLDALVHSAAIWNEGPIDRIRAEQLEEIFRVNVFSAFYLVRELLPHLGRNGRGNVIFVGSTAGQRGEARHGHYAATKGALQSLAMSLAVELAPATRVNVVSPGWVRTPMAEAELRELGAAISGALPNRRVAEVDDVVHACLYLASEASGHLVGEDLSVSGGALLVVPRGQVVAREV